MIQNFKIQEYLTNRIDGYRIRMNSISFPSYSVMRDRYESWILGDPEWNIEIVSANMAQTVQNIGWNGISSCCQTLPQPTCTTIDWWRYNATSPKVAIGDVLTFHMWEKDNDPVTITLSIGKVTKVKLTDIISYEFSMGVSASFKLGDGNDEVGKSMLYFWNNANNFNFQINDCTINLDQIPSSN